MRETLSSSYRRLALILIGALIFSVSAPVPLRAQSTSGTLVGQVFDPSGKQAGNAKVTVVNENNGNTRATITDSAGTYRIPFLPPGIYSISASLAGYSDAGIRGFRVPLNATSIIEPPEIKLQPASSPAQDPTKTPQPGGQAIERPELGTLIRTTESSRGGNFTERQVESLPLGGTTDMRTFDEFALLLPGVLPPPYTPGVRGPGVGFGIGTAGQFSVNGLRARSNNFTVDGSDNNDPDVGVRRQGFVALVPQPIESIQEFQVSTLLWDAEQGRNFGAQVNAVSKDGRNDFHGRLYAFFTDSSLNARNNFDFTDGPTGRENPFTRTQTGFAIGGPIKRDRTQFFSSFEHEDINASIEQHFSSPTPGERRFGGLPEFGVLNPTPEFTGLVFRTVLGSTPVGDNILSFYPLPNNPGGPYGSNTYTEELPADGDGNIFSFKVTHSFSQRNTLNARYNITDDNRVLPSVNRAIRSVIEADSRTQNLSLILDSQLSQTVFNQARFSFGRTRLDFLEYPGSPFIFSSSSEEELGTEEDSIIRTSNTGPIGELIVEPFSPVGVDVYSFPQERANNTFQIADSISWTYGPHSLKLGGDIRRIQLNSLQERNYRPLVVFGNGIQVLGDLNDDFSFSPDFNTARLISGAQLATIGLPSSIFQTLTVDTPDSRIGIRFTEYNFFFNDSWRVSPNFTLDYGVRYEYNSVPHEVNDRIERALRLENLPTLGVSPGNTSARTAAFNAAVDAYREILEGRRKIYKPDSNNFGPHVGFAWSPGADKKTAIRGGYGIYYDAILGAVVSQSRNIFPTEVPINVEPAFIPIDVLVLNSPSFLALLDGAGGPLGSPIPLINPQTLNQIGGGRADLIALLGQLFNQSDRGSALAFTLPAKNLRTPYAQHWHLTIERELFSDFAISAAYVGTKGTKLTRLTTPNLGPNVTSLVSVARANTGGNLFNFPLVVPEASSFPLEQTRPEQALGPYQIYENSARSNYHALQLEGRTRYRNGFSLTMAYTWSHAIDQVSDVFPIAGAPILPQNSFDLNAERGDANFDVRHRFSTSFIWELPFYRGESGGVAAVLGGWQLASIFQAHTGQPFTLNLPIDANLDGNLTDRPSTTQGLVFSDGHSSQRVSTGGRPVTDFFVLGEDGFEGRNTVRADGFINLDLALSKTFRISEDQGLEFRAEVFNALNRANYGIPIRVIGAPGFGSSVDTVNPARIVQLALKYSF